MEVRDLLFFYFLHLFSQNLIIMKKINRFFREIETNHKFLDYFLSYIFVVISLQADYAFRFIENYLRKENVNVPLQHAFAFS